MTTAEKKPFDCPKCGVQSWLDPATFEVTHDEPKCPAWLAMETSLLFSLVDFKCSECEKPARMYPLAKPIAVEHSEPVCEQWKKIVGKKDDVERYLIKAGVHVHVPPERYLENSSTGERVADSGTQPDDTDHE